MLKLIYDYRAGFEELYITEKDVEQDLSQFAAEGEPMDYEALYEQYKDNPEMILEDIFDIEDCIDETTREEVAHTYFKDICFAKGKKPIMPGYFKMYNIRLEYISEDSAVDDEISGITEHEPTVNPDGSITKRIDVDCTNKSKEQIAQDLRVIKKKYERPATLKAKDVLAILGISRASLSGYVKQGLIKATTSHEGGQYEYDAESVYELKRKWNLENDHVGKLIKLGLDRKIAERMIALTEVLGGEPATAVVLYEQAFAKQNDIEYWRPEDHITFVKAFILDSIMLDPKRYFTFDDKMALLNRDGPICSHADADGRCVNSEDYGEILYPEHIVLWEKGGRTDIKNGQLVCGLHTTEQPIHIKYQGKEI